MKRFLALSLLVSAALLVIAARPRLSEDRELKELNLSGWDCLNRMEGSAKTPEQMERNRLKNRSVPEGHFSVAANLDSASFLKYVAEFEGQTVHRKRNEIVGAQKELLDPLEKRIVTLTGYLQLAYPGPPETTNCGSTDFHDWHLEILDRPLDHPPRAGDPTSIICEITPRTQNQVYRDGIRIQELAGFFRHSDNSYEPTGHPAQKIRLTGYLLWDDEHNGTADVGPNIQNAPPLKFHNPWRQAAWEIHPVIKIERADGSPPPPVTEPGAAAPAPEKSGSPAEGAPPAAPTPVPTNTPAPTPMQQVTITIPLRIPTPAGEAVIPRGTRLPVVARDSQTVTVQYNGQNVIIQNTYTTDFH